MQGKIKEDTHSLCRLGSFVVEDEYLVVVRILVPSVVVDLSGIHVLCRMTFDLVELVSGWPSSSHSGRFFQSLRECELRKA